MPAAASKTIRFSMRTSITPQENIPRMAPPSNASPCFIGSLFCYDSSVFRRIRNDILFRHFYYNIHKTAWVELLEPDLHKKTLRPDIPGRRVLFKCFFN